MEKNQDAKRKIYDTIWKKIKTVKAKYMTHYGKYSTFKDWISKLKYFIVAFAQITTPPYRADPLFEQFQKEKSTWKVKL